jgi:hypothetical protein
MKNCDRKKPLALPVLIIVFAYWAAGCATPIQAPLTSVSSLQLQQTGQPSACQKDEFSPLGVLRSTDHGATWVHLGNACWHDRSIAAADPTAIAIDGGIALYFLDLNTLANNQTITAPRIIYRATTVDGVNFEKPQPVFTQTHNIVDPFVLRTPEGFFRMYIASENPEGIVSATSSDGLFFTLENGVRSTAGAMPGALLLPDNRVRLFLAGGNDGQAGIFSQISTDGLHFTTEPGVRIPASIDTIADNPQPIRLADGSFLMLFQIRDKKIEGDPLQCEIHLATSTDGLLWIANPIVIEHGGTTSVIETADGTLYIYFGSTFPK